MSNPALAERDEIGNEPDDNYVGFSSISLTLGGERILEDLTFTVRRGEFCCVLGPSGCGKSTSLRLLGDLLQPASGSITIEGRPPSQTRSKLAFVFQSPRLVAWRNVLKNTLLGSDLRFGRRSRRKYLGPAERYLELVGLLDAKHKYPFMLSGGERQRVAIARALTVNPDIVLMDEPFSALDPNTRRRMQGEILDIWRTTGKTIIFVTHDVNEAIALADRIVMLSHKPTRVLKEIPVTAPRPRNVDHDPVLQKIRLDLTSLFTAGIQTDAPRRNEDEPPTVSQALGRARHTECGEAERRSVQA